LKYGQNNKFTGVQHFEIFEFLIEFATTIEVLETTTKQRVIILEGQCQLGHFGENWGGDILPWL
jgi:hypothetical protein